MARAKETVTQKIQEYIRVEYGGSCDIEISDSLDFCSYFHLKYNGNMEGLQEKFMRLENKLKALTGWNPNPPQETVVPPNPDDPPEFMVAPWQLGVTPNHSVKGKSKSVHILDTVQHFLKSAYNSKKEPLELLFAPGAREGEVIGSWSMVHSVGMGKSSACRMILEAACSLNLTDEELQSTANIFKALLRMRCIYDPAENEELQLLKSMAAKTVLAERPRPDPLMWATRWQKVIASRSLVFSEVIAQKIREYSKDKTEGATISRAEAEIITFLPLQGKEFLDLLEYHWQNYKVQESAVNIKRLCLKDLNPALKARRCSKDNALFLGIFRWTQEKCHYWLIREVGTFVMRIKSAIRAGRKVNLKGNSRELRGDISQSSHDEACIFVHFLPQIMHHTSASQYQELQARFSKGHLNKEPAEKAKLMDPDLKVMDFRFMQMITSSSPGPGSGSNKPTEEEAETRAEEAELNLVEVKLGRERESWQAYQQALKAHHAKSHEDKKEINAAFATKLNAKTDELCNLICPTRRLSEEVVQTFIAESLAAWADSQGISKVQVPVVFLVRFDALGTHLLPQCPRLHQDHSRPSCSKSAVRGLGPGP